MTTGLAKVALLTTTLFTAAATAGDTHEAVSNELIFGDHAVECDTKKEAQLQSCETNLQDNRTACGNDENCKEEVAETYRGCLDETKKKNLQCLLPGIKSP